MNADLYTRDGRLLRYRDRVRTLDGKQWYFVGATRPTERRPMGEVKLRALERPDDDLLVRYVYPSAINASFLK